MDRYQAMLIARTSRRWAQNYSDKPSLVARTSWKAPREASLASLRAEQKENTVPMTQLAKVARFCWGRTSQGGEQTRDDFRRMQTTRDDCSARATTHLLRKKTYEEYEAASGVLRQWVLSVEWCLLVEMPLLFTR
ncbi:hypothetical protein Y032_0625g794 [Ancylostoma ceylanicum]|uniref:Uncharacterized protein n=1 Tax=Ancylostoma ceylanicum TaxID=53326 RepID=A0A016WKL5_9BILA|nr:hypothetical protein Y032_0625g794 [Ancylostoma ceylanicum]